MIFNPVRDEWHSAARGQGAFHDGRRVKVDEATRLDEVVVGVGFYYLVEYVERFIVPWAPKFTRS